MICKKPFRVGTLSFGCGQCLPCRINKKRVWSHRILLESYKHEHSCFVTLTYDREYLPSDGSLNPKHTQDWLKRLRERFYPTKFRYYLVGEYGDESQRPHYHVALFGYPRCPFTVPGERIIKQCECEACLPISETWKMGLVTLHALEPDSAAYICGYVTKKMTSVRDEKVKAWLNGRHPEFARMSRKPGIGAPAMKEIADRIEEYGDLILEDGDVPLSLRHGSKKMPLGRYLRQKLREEAWLADQKEVSLQKYMEKNREEKMQLQNEAYEKGGAEEFKKRELELKERDKQIIRNIESKFEIFKKKGHL